MNRCVLVVGGGIAGIEVALALSELHCEITLVEHGAFLGGNITELFSLHGVEQSPAEWIGRKIAAIHANPNSRVLLKAVVREVTGNVGNFHVRIDSPGETHEGDFGAIVIATGFETDGVSADADSLVGAISYAELEKKLATIACQETQVGRTRSAFPKNVCFVVDSDGIGLATHSAAALKNAVAIQKIASRNVFICCEDVQVAGEGLESLYREARAHGAVILKSDGEKPRLAASDAGFSVTVRDTSLSVPGQHNGVVEVHCDLLVLPQRIVPRQDTPSLQKLLRVDVDSSNYFQQNNVWLKPTASNRKGIFFVGACRGSFDVSDILDEARATALEVYNSIARGEAGISGDRVSVDAAKCALCLTCLRSCPHGAVEIVFDDKVSGRTAHIVSSACYACGICVAECPAKAIHMVVPDEEQEVAVAAH